MKGLGFYDSEFVRVKSDNDLFAESITRILMTSPGERVGQPFFGVGLKRALFDQIDEVSLQNLERIINEQIETYEPRVNLTKNHVETDTNNHKILIQLAYRIKGEPFEDERFIDFTFDLEG